MTFLGFRLNGKGDLLDLANNAVLEKNLMNPTLRGQLNAQGVNFDADYEKRDRLACIILYYMKVVFVYKSGKCNNYYFSLIKGWHVLKTCAV